MVCKQLRIHTIDCKTIFTKENTHLEKAGGMTSDRQEVMPEGRMDTGSFQTFLEE